MRKLILTLCLMMFSAGILAAGEWHGTWQTNWRQGGAELELVQEGNQVRGHYEPFNGTIEAIVNDDGSLTGTWKQPGSEGEFMFTLAEDKKTFSGRFDSGEWWNGVKVSNKAELGKSLYVHLESPRATLKSFLNAGNWIAYGNNNYIDDLIETVILPAQGEVLYRQKFEVAQLYFRLIGMDTIRLFNLPDEAEGDEFSFELFRRQNDFSHSIRFIKNDKGWHIVLPKRTQIRALINEAEEAGIYRQKAPNGHFDLNTPRETIRTFLEEFSRFNQGTETIVLNTLNVSMLDESVRQWEAPVVAQYLKEVLDRISYVVWQEIPNDPDSTVPYRHFTHPKGIIEVAPATRDGKTVWLFTPKTIDNIRALHDGVENLPLPEGIPPFENTAFFFNVRDYVKQLPGPLTNRYFNLELWQWIGALLLLLFSFTLSNLVRIRLNRFVKILPGFRSRTLSNINAIVGIPAMLITIGLIWVYALFIFGIPDYLFSFLRTLSQLLITLGSIWLGYVAVTEISKYLLSKALQTESIIDEIIVTLISSLIKGGVIIFGVMLIAES